VSAAPQHEKPLSAPAVLEYAPASDASGRAVRKFVHILAIVLGLAMVISLLPVARLLVDIGPQTAPLPNAQLAGLQNPSAVTKAVERLSAAAGHIEVNTPQWQALLAFIQQCGVTALLGDGQAPPLDEVMFVEKQWVLGQHGWDMDKHIWWCRLKGGWLEVGDRSALYWPDHKQWFYEFRSGPDATGIYPDPPYPVETSQVHYLELPPEIYRAYSSFTGSSAGFNIEFKTELKSWEAPAAVRLALWSGYAAGLFVAILALTSLRRAARATTRRWIAGSIFAWIVAEACIWWWALPQVARTLESLIRVPLAPVTLLSPLLFVIPALAALLGVVLVVHSLLPPLTACSAESRG
jgi:hypothetical protein